MRNQILVSKYYSPIKVNRGSLEKLDYKIAIMKIQDWIGDSLASVKKKGDDFEKKKKDIFSIIRLKFCVSNPNCSLPSHLTLVFSGLQGKEKLHYTLSLLRRPIIRSVSSFSSF